MMSPRRRYERYERYDTENRPYEGLRRGMRVEVRHEAGVEIGTVTGWTHGDGLPLVSIDWADGTNSSVSSLWIVREVED